MGPKSLKKIVAEAHKRDKGVIALCHMSAPEAKLSYEINVKLSKNSKPKPLYHLFLKWAISNKADGIIVGATFPKIVNDCKKIVPVKNLIFIHQVLVSKEAMQKRQLQMEVTFSLWEEQFLSSKNPVRTVKQLLSDSL